MVKWYYYTTCYGDNSIIVFSISCQMLFKHLSPDQRNWEAELRLFPYLITGCTPGCEPLIRPMKWDENRAQHVNDSRCSREWKECKWKRNRGFQNHFLSHSSFFHHGTIGHMIMKIGWTLSKGDKFQLCSGDQFNVWLWQNAPFGLSEDRWASRGSQPSGRY